MKQLTKANSIKQLKKLKKTIMKTLLLLSLLLISIGVKAQTKWTIDTTNIDRRISALEQKLDTLEVIGYCLNKETLEVSWHRLFAVYGYSKMAVNVNGLMIYQEYLMPDRKTKSIYTVIYSIKK